MPDASPPTADTCSACRFHVGGFCREGPPQLNHLAVRSLTEFGRAKPEDAALDPLVWTLPPVPPDFWCGRFERGEPIPPTEG